MTVQITVETSYNVSGLNGFSVTTFSSASPTRSLIDTVLLDPCLLRLWNSAFLHAILHLVCDCAPEMGGEAHP